MNLLDAILIFTKCKSIEELQDLSVDARKKLAQSIEKRVGSGLATIEEWNKVISCFADAQPQTDNAAAKSKLLEILREE